MLCYVNTTAASSLKYWPRTGYPRKGFIIFLSPYGCPEDNSIQKAVALSQILSCSASSLCIWLSSLSNVKKTAVLLLSFPSLWWRYMHWSYCKYVRYNMGTNLSYFKYVPIYQIYFKFIKFVVHNVPFVQCRPILSIYDFHNTVTCRGFTCDF
jgi:hypothetical protein